MRGDNRVHIEVSPPHRFRIVFEKAKVKMLENIPGRNLVVIARETNEVLPEGALECGSM